MLLPLAPKSNVRPKHFAYVSDRRVDSDSKRNISIFLKGMYGNRDQRRGLGNDLNENYILQ